MNFEAIAQTVGVNLIRAYIITALIVAGVVAIYGLTQIIKILSAEKKRRK